MINTTTPIAETNRSLPISREPQTGGRQQREDMGNLTSRAEQPSKTRMITEKELVDAVEESNRIIFGDTEKFEFKIHERTGRYLVKLVDNETDEVIREIPPEKILDLIANIWEMVGILVDERG
jgi:flagellar protein FlaG